MDRQFTNDARFRPMMSLEIKFPLRTPTPEEWQLVVENRKLIGYAIRLYGGRYLHAGYDRDDLADTALAVLLRCVQKHNPELATLATFFCVSVKRWWRQQLLHKVKYPVSCHGKRNDSPYRLAMIDAQPAEPWIDFDDVESDEHAIFLDAVLRKRLAVRDYDIFARRRDDETLDSIGQSYGISRERVRQIECRVNAKARELLAPHL